MLRAGTDAPYASDVLRSHRSRAHRRCDVAKVSKETASEVMAVEGYEGRSEDLGGYTVAWESFTSDQEPAPRFHGFPHDHCQCLLWGIVIAGELRCRFNEGTSGSSTFH